MNRAKEQALTEFLKEFISEHKQNLLDEVLNNRTRYITLALEDIYQPQNASAVIRSCDCFGIQDLHIIENRNEYNINPMVAQGSSKWVNLIQYNEGDDNTDSCISHLREKGYRIVATSPSATAMSIHDFSPTAKTAFLFGTEMTGLSKKALKLSDEVVNIPMYGFTESFNISVSAALLLQLMRQKLEILQVDYLLSTQEKNELRIEWYKNVISNSESYVNHFESNWNEKSG